MLARSSVKTVLLCGCAVLVLPVLSSVVSSRAGDLSPFASPVPVVPVSADAGSMMILPQEKAVAAQPAASAPVMPQVTAAPAQAAVIPAPQEPKVLAVAPGENPFAPSQAAPVAATQAPRVQATPVSIDLGKALPQAGVQQAGAQPGAAAGANPFASSAPAPKSADNAAAAPQEPKVDDTALRYYASTRDLKRLGAELRRLKALYPNWEPPENLFDQSATVDEQPLWDMYAAGNYTGMRAELARLQSTNPQWKASADLLKKLSMAESRKVIDRAYGQNNWPQVISTAGQQPDLLVCGEMNAMWQVGEALARTRDFNHSFELYKYILTHCDGTPERVATMQKASLLLPEAGVTSLLTFGRTLPDGTSEFASIAFDGTRRRMGQIAAADQMAQRPQDQELQNFSSYVQATQSAADAGLFGWYYYSQKQWQASSAWFTLATQFGTDPKNVEGLILAQRNLGKMDAAYALASQNMAKSDGIREQYIEIVASALTDKQPTLKISDQDIGTFKDAVFDAKSALGAQALGWKSLADTGVKEAAPLFAQSYEWDVTQGGVLGMAVVAARTKDYTKLASLKSEYGKTYSDLDNFKIYYSKPRSAKAVRAAPVKKPERKKSLLAALFD
jgi:cellulose synthase operon protein C